MSFLTLAILHRLMISALSVNAACSLDENASAQEAVWPAKTYYRYHVVKRHRIFYREAGAVENTTIVLLYGYPSSSHTYRELIPLLSGRFHVIAADNLGSGFSEHPDPDVTAYTFDLLADYVEELIDALGIERYVIYMQDFGAPVGYRVMMRQPKRVRALIVQNANAFMDGLTEQRRTFLKQANQDRSEAGLKPLLEFVGRESIVHKQYLRDVKGKEEIMSPDSWTHDTAFLQTPKDRMIQVELFQDYYNNLLAYPKWQKFLREEPLPTLIVWGKNDTAFIAAGAKAYLRDLPMPNSI
jgi:pimeloyl-ACP methyl ester carboxylesterase